MPLLEVNIIDIIMYISDKTDKQMFDCNFDGHIIQCCFL